MPRQLFCANCGTELFITQKAISKLQKVISVLPPHTCSEELETELLDTIPKSESKPTTKKDGAKSLDKAFDSLKFVSKLNELSPKPVSPLLSGEPGDKRPKEDLRNDVISSTPAGIAKAVSSCDISTGPERE